MLSNKKILIGLLASSLFTYNAIAQQKEELFKINDQPYYTDEFLRIYKKNLDLVKDDSQKNISNYFDLYLGYKLKVAKAYKENLHLNTKYQNELNSHRTQLSKNYVNDTKVTNKLIEEAYNRLKKEIRASHILISVDESVKGKDTLAFYNKALSLKKMIESGKSFEEIAQENSQDPSVKENKGDLGYFTAFRMVYPFENAAYKTPKDKISLPFRTRFGYHILKVTDVRDNRGDITAAHIMLLKKENQTEEDKQKSNQTINELYQKLKQGESFEKLAEQFSEDKSTASKGGVLQRFGSGQLSSTIFEEKCFALKNIDDYSEPFESEFGWHIVKLKEKHPILGLDVMKPELENKIRRDERSLIITNSLAQDLRKKYSVEINPTVKDKTYKELTDDLYSQTWEVKPTKDKGIEDFITLNKIEKISGTAFLNFVNVQQKTKLTTKPLSKLGDELLEKFKDEQLIAFYNKNLENEFPEFKNIMDEYRDGLLLFDLMEKEIWLKSKSDTLALQKFYKENLKNYQWKERYKVSIFTSKDEKSINKAYKLAKNKDGEYIKSKLNQENKVVISNKTGLFEKDYSLFSKTSNLNKGINSIFKDGEYFTFIKVEEILPAQAKSLDECKGKLISDYQTYLEEHWVDNLKKEFKIEINQPILEKIKTQINK